MVGSDSDFRDAFLEAAARAFFTCAYADYCEEHTDEDLPKPGPGGDWMDFAPEPPPNAFAIAGEMWARIEEANKANMYMIADVAQAADGKPVDPAKFGHALAMQYMGTGVSWFDDHKEFPLKVPYAEVSWFNFSEECYRQ